ncbi:MAG: phosphate ABC transporter permease subunit PstC [Thermoplasmata archaeon]
MANPFQPVAARDHPRAWRRLGDIIFGVLTGVGGIIILVLVALIAILLYHSSLLSIQTFGPQFFWTSTWNPITNVYGVVPFVAGTLITSSIALLIGVPLALGSAIFITTRAPGWLRGPVGMVIELLAAIPSVVFGLWALYVVVPWMRESVDPLLAKYLGWTGLFGGTATGQDVLTAGVVLAIMVIPTISAISRETMAAVPPAQHEAALSLGATDWEATRRATIPYARLGIFGAVILGLGRALGETMAVTMTIGNANVVPTSLFSQGASIASLVANEFPSATSPLEYSAIFEAALVLLVISIAVNVVARLMVWKVLKVHGATAE